jgi:plastocyanin
MIVNRNSINRTRMSRPMRPRTTNCVLLAGLGLALGLPAAGAGVATPPLNLVLKDHRFTPAALTVPAGQKVQIVLLNQDRATEEFDSGDLNVEEMVTPGGQVIFSIGPLKPGTYAFMGEFHPATAQGQIIAVETRP